MSNALEWVLFLFLSVQKLNIILLFDVNLEKLNLLNMR